MELSVNTRSNLSCMRELNQRSVGGWSCLLESFPMQASFSWVTFFAGLISGFLPGLFSGYLLQRLKEKRDARLRLSEKIYGPLYQQIYEAAQQIEQRKKAVSANARLWESIKSQGLTSEIEASLLKNLSELFYQVFPNYDAAWEEACNRKIPALLRDWDENFGNPPGPRGVQYVSWWTIATDENYRLPFTELLPDQSLLLLDRTIGWATLDASGWSVDSFIQARRRELMELPAVVNYMRCRREALTRTAEVLHMLKLSLRH